MAVDQKPNDYPLQWPAGVARTSRPATAQFRTTLAAAMNNVRDSLAKFGADSGTRIKPDDVVISSNVTLGKSNPTDRGIAVWFIWEGEWRCIAVDRYEKVEFNVQAIHHVIEAERTKLRHGGLNIVRATFKAFLALPSSGPDCWQVLGLEPGSSAVEIKARFRKLAADRHPDKPTGSHAAMTELTAAYSDALGQAATEKA